MTGEPSAPMAIELYQPRSDAVSSMTSAKGGSEYVPQTTLPSTFTPRRYSPRGQTAATLSWTSEALTCVAPTAPAAIFELPTAPSASMLDVTPAAAIARLPAAVIGPPVRPAPAPTLVT